ncbi:hypothetical protein BCR41DRAFT_351257, partial [Lobosporangium transversale]
MDQHILPLSPNKAVAATTTSTSTLTMTTTTTTNEAANSMPCPKIPDGDMSQGRTMGTSQQPLTLYKGQVEGEHSLGNNDAEAEALKQKLLLLSRSRYDQLSRSMENLLKGFSTTMDRDVSLLIAELHKTKTELHDIRIAYAELQSRVDSERAQLRLTENRQPCPSTEEQQQQLIQISTLPDNIQKDSDAYLDQYPVHHRTLMELRWQNAEYLTQLQQQNQVLINLKNELDMATSELMRAMDDINTLSSQKREHLSAISTLEREKEQLQESVHNKTVVNSQLGALLDHRLNELRNITHINHTLKAEVEKSKLLLGNRQEVQSTDVQVGGVVDVEVKTLMEEVEKWRLECIKYSGFIAKYYEDIVMVVARRHNTSLNTGTASAKDFRDIKGPTLGYFHPDRASNGIIQSVTHLVPGTAQNSSMHSSNTPLSSAQNNDQQLQQRPAAEQMALETSTSVSNVLDQERTSIASPPTMDRPAFIDPIVTSESNQPSLTEGRLDPTPQLPRLSNQKHQALNLAMTPLQQQTAQTLDMSKHAEEQQDHQSHRVITTAAANRPQDPTFDGLTNFETTQQGLGQARQLISMANTVTSSGTAANQPNNVSTIAKPSPTSGPEEGVYNQSISTQVPASNGALINSASISSEDGSQPQKQSIFKPPLTPEIFVSFSSSRKKIRAAPRISSEYGLLNLEHTASIQQGKKRKLIVDGD